VYSLYDYAALRYEWDFNEEYDDTHFQKFDKQKLIDKYKQEKKNKQKKILNHFFIIVGAILAIGTVNIVIVKKSIIKIETTNIRKKEKIC
jgi:hypothetical protein